MADGEKVIPLLRRRNPLEGVPEPPSSGEFYFDCGGLGCDRHPCICPKPRTRLSYKVAWWLLGLAGYFSRYNIFWPGRIASQIAHFEWEWREGRFIRRDGRIPF